MGKRPRGTKPGRARCKPNKALAGCSCLPAPETRSEEEPDVLHRWLIACETPPPLCRKRAASVDAVRTDRVTPARHRFRNI